jgi:membrane protein DedA with SNARE-associated domain
MAALSQSLVSHPYLILVLCSFLERAGLPLLLSPVLIAAGAVAATGQMHFDVAVWMALAACIAGDTLWYELGRTKGDSVLHTLCRISLEPESCVRRSRKFFEKGASRTLLFSKWLPGLSHILPAVAGLSGVDRQTFFLINLAGSAIWIVAFMLAGYVPVARAHLSPEIGRFVFEAGMALLMVNIGIKYIRKQRFLQELEKARISPQDLRQMLDSGENPVILDLRHPLDSVTDPRTLPGAIRVLPDEVVRHAERLPKGQEIILYCT